MFKRWGVGLLGLLVGGWLTASLLLLPNIAISVADNPVTENPGTVGIEFADIVVPSEEVDLAGWWIPAKDPRAILLFAHGAGSNRTSWFLPSLAFYQAMTDLGVSVITVDMRNHGNSPKTDGTLGMGGEEWPDMLAMARWLDANGHTALPRLAMGISMGGATTVHALTHGLDVEAAILFDPALDTPDALASGGWISSGLPRWLFQPYAWATTRFWGLPWGDNDAGSRALKLDLPMLLIQDPTDPITRLPFAEALAAGNSQVQLALAPMTPENADCLTGKGRWGAHVAAFNCHPEWTLSVLSNFIDTQL